METRKFSSDLRVTGNWLVFYVDRALKSCISALKTISDRINPLGKTQLRHPLSLPTVWQVSETGPMHRDTCKSNTRDGIRCPEWKSYSAYMLHQFQILHGNHPQFSKGQPWWQGYNICKSPGRLGNHYYYSSFRISFKIHEMQTSLCLIRSSYRSLNFLIDKMSLTKPHQFWNIQRYIGWDLIQTFNKNPFAKQNRSTEGFSKLKRPETRPVQKRLVSTLEHLQVPKWDRTSCLEELTSSVGMPHLLQMFSGNLGTIHINTATRQQRHQRFDYYCLDHTFTFYDQVLTAFWNLLERVVNLVLFADSAHVDFLLGSH